MKFRLFIAAVAALVCTVAAHAQSFAGMVRDDMALGLTPTVTNWGMGGAYVGVPGADSMNPAALAFAKERQLDISAGYWRSCQGPDAYSGRADVIFPFVLDSHARLMVYYYGSDGYGLTDIGLEGQYSSQTFGLQLGIPVTENIGLGFGAYPHEKGRVDFRAPNGGPDIVEAEGNSQLGSIQAGAQWRATEELTIGLEAIYIIDEMQADYLDMGSGTYRYMSSDYTIHYEAIGASYKITPKTLVAVDFRTGEINGDDVGGVDFDQDVHRWHYGIEQEVTDLLTLRAGSSNDGFTAGLTLDFTESLALNYVFNDRAFRDKETVLGETDVHSISVTYKF